MFFCLQIYEANLVINKTHYSWYLTLLATAVCCEHTLMRAKLTFLISIISIVIILFYFLNYVWSVAFIILVAYMLANVKTTLYSTR